MRLWVFLFPVNKTLQYQSPHDEAGGSVSVLETAVCAVLRAPHGEQTSGLMNNMLDAEFDSDSLR